MSAGRLWSSTWRRSYPGNGRGKPWSGTLLDCFDCQDHYGLRKLCQLCNFWLDRSRCLSAADSEQMAIPCYCIFMSRDAVSCDALDTEQPKCNPNLFLCIFVVLCTGSHSVH